MAGALGHPEGVSRSLWGNGMMRDHRIMLQIKGDEQGAKGCGKVNSSKNEDKLWEQWAKKSRTRENAI